jgi:hypothetical protein
VISFHTRPDEKFDAPDLIVVRIKKTDVKALEEN